MSRAALEREEARRLVSAAELLPHADAAARSWRNTKVGLIGAPLALVGILGSGLIAAVALDGGVGGEEGAILGSLFGVVALIGVLTVVLSVRSFLRDEGRAALRTEAVVRVDYSYLQVLTGYRTIATYTLASGRRFACDVPADFGRAR